MGKQFFSSASWPPSFLHSLSVRSLALTTGKQSFAKDYPFSANHKHRIPVQMVSWSLVASFQAFLSGRSSFFACRALLGLIEGGFIPDNILYLSYFYTGVELPGRLSWFWVSYQSTQIISAFFAFGILRLRGHNGMEGWRWLFALEGMLTGIIGILSWFYLPPSPTQTAT
jgi:hypothetical protein